jgi:hypothetical protein
MQRTARSLLAICLLVLASAAPARALGPVITEFMAANENGLTDEDGEFSDWIEIYNPTLNALSLEGWFLTDRLNEPTQWRFPAVSIASHGYLVVFASEKNRLNPARPLHTNFRLGTEGEFLGLYDPALNLVSSFSPAYPPQLAGVSYGIPQPATTLGLIAAGAASTALVPADGSLGSTWTAEGFSDSTWLKGTTGAGYDTGADYGALIGTDLLGAMRTRNGSAYLRIPFNLDSSSGIDSLALRIKYDDGFVAYLNGQEVARKNAPSPIQWNSLATAQHGQPVTGSMAQDFDTAGTPYALMAYGTASPPVVKTGGPTGSYLQLMPDGVGDLQNTIGFDRTFGPADLVIIDFDYRMPVEAGHTGCCGERADGFGFALLATVEYGSSGPAPSVNGVVWERPAFPDAFGVGFDIFNGAGTENTISLDWNGVEAASTLVTAFPLNNGVFDHAHLEVRKDGTDSLVSMTLTPDSLGSPGAPVQVFQDTRVRGMNPLDARVGFGGRTGGAFTSVDLDNIKVLFTPGTTAIAYEELDISTRANLLHAGKNVLAIQGLNLTAGDSDFLILPELTATRFGSVDQNARQYFPVATPGQPNGPGYPGVAAEPVFSAQSGCYAQNFSLTLSAGDPGTSIRYTLDGSTPGPASTLYSAAITVQKNLVVKARGFKSGLLASRTIDRTYVRLDAGVSGFSSNLPLVIVNTYGLGIGQDSLTPVSSIFIDNLGDRTLLTDAPDFAGSAGIKIRGSSSTGFPKKQFSFETWDENRQDRQVSILGFPKQSDWILYGPYTDKTLMRDALSYGWSNRIGRYAVRSRYVEMFLHSGTGTLLSSADYLGVYVFFEKIKRDKNRVDLKKLLPSDDVEPAITGGYILKKDRLDPGDSGFVTSTGQLLAYVDPKEQEITPAQTSYIVGYLDDFEAALYGPDFQDPDLGFRRYIDIDSFIDHHLLVEMTKNIDGFRLSTFMYKDRGEKLGMGPIWDYNLTLGNANYLDGWKPEGWYHDLLGDGDYPWWRRLFQDPDFNQRYIDRWTQLRRTELTTDNLLADVDSTVALLDEAQVRNYQKWPILGTYVWPNQFIGNTYQEEIDFMSGWLQARLAWMDGNWLAPPVFSQEGGVVSPTFDLTMTVPSGTVYYTTDGVDPRLPGGEIAPGAVQYGSSSQLTLVSSTVTPQLRVLVPTADQGQGWIQPGFNDSTWTLGSSGLGVGYEAATGYETYIKVDVKAQMYQKTSTVYIRIPFSAPDPASLDSLTLRMRYDDGFVAFLNGQQVASRNAPSPAAWNSTATVTHDDAQAVIFEAINITGFLSALRSGANVLAIQGLNASNTSSDLLIEPRLEASSSRPADPIPIRGATFIRARSWLDGSWSGLSEATFVPDVPLLLRVTELMYHPAPPPPGSPYTADDFEFIELENVGPGPLSLLGARFTLGIQFDLSSGAVTTLSPGQYVLLVKNLEAFSSRYDTRSMAIAGEYQGNLDNDGEPLLLLDGRGVVTQSFTYDDLWYPVTDGLGYSLHIVNAAGDPAGWGSRSSWAPSGALGGSPGGPEGAVLGGFQRPGDANQDARVDLSDAVALLFYLYLGTSRPLPCGGGSGSPGNLAVLDVNGDSQLDLADPISLLGYLFRGGPPPASGADCLRASGCPDSCNG